MKIGRTNDVGRCGKFLISFLKPLSPNYSVIFGAFNLEQLCSVGAFIKRLLVSSEESWYFWNFKNSWWVFSSKKIACVCVCVCVCMLNLWGGGAISFSFWPHPWPVEFPGPRIEPTLPHQLEPQRWQYQVLNPLSHKGTHIFHFLKMFILKFSFIFYQKNTCSWFKKAKA